ncbi:MAG: exodeoxyribonuclease V subunit gamma [Elusimicrobia bacterium]|nr:exodeoxyribonuclease V subunit gamma [Elusimicrobiota bacterium]
MPLRMVCGPYQPSLEDAFVVKARSLFEERKEFAVVAPSRRMAGRLQRLLALERGLVLLGARFHTFHSLALEILEEGGFLVEKVVTDGLFHDRIIDRLLAARQGGRRLPRGLAAAYRSSIRDLVDCALDPAEFRSACGDKIGEMKQARQLLEVLSLQEEYLAELKAAGILPPSGLARRATEVLREPETGALSRYAELLYYGFYDLTGAQADFFEAVWQAREVTLFYPYRKGHPAFAFAKEFYELRAGAAAPEHLPGGVETRALGPVLDAFGSPEKRAALPRPEALSVVSASGAEDEVWAAAKEILALTSREAEPVAFDDIGVVARTLEPYRSAVVRIFGDNAIPYAMDAGEPLLRHPIAKLVLNLLRIEAMGFTASAVLDIVGSRYFRVERYERDPKKGRKLVRRWKRLVGRLGIEGGWRQWEGMLAPYLDQDLELEPGRAGEEGPDVITKEDTARFWRLLRDLRERASGPLGGPAAPGERRTAAPGACGPAGKDAKPAWDDMARHALGTVGAFFAVDGRSPGDPPSAGARAWTATLGCIRSLSIFEPACPGARWEEFLDTLDEKLKAAALEPPPERLGVRVLDAMDGRGESFRFLFLLGLQEGVFPRQVREDFLLRDETRVALHEDAGYLIRPKKGPGYDEERLLFYLLVSSASERVTASFQRSDEEGKAVTPSDYLRKLCQASGTCAQSAGAPGAGLDAAVSRRIARQPVTKLWELERTCPEALAPKEISLIHAIRGVEPEGLFEGLAGLVPSFDEPALFRGGIRAVASLNAKGEPGPLDGLVDPPRDFVESIEASGLSPSSLETFRRCPFRFFAAKLLMLREDEEPSSDGELVAAYRGKLYHKVLEKLHRGLAGGGFWKAPPDGKRWRRELDRCIGEVLEPTLWRRYGVYPVLWEALVGRMTRHLRRLTAGDIEDCVKTGLLPGGFFEVELDAEVEGTRFHGRADRIDVDAERNRYRIVDYKSRHRGGTLKARLSSMSELQPPIYLELARSMRGLLPEGCRPHGAAFFGIEESPETTGSRWKEELPFKEIEAAKKRFFENIAVFKRMMAEGRFIITPEEGRGMSCDWCGFGGVCRKAHRSTRRRAERSALREDLEKARKVASDA